MKSRMIVALGVFALAVGTLFAAEATDKVDFSKIKCIVSGKEVNPEATAEYKDAKVYFCCPGCPGAFAKDSKKFATKANHQLVATHQAKQTGCPMSGEAVDPDTAIKVGGVDVAFCCGNCKGAAEKKEGDEQVELIFNDKSFEKGFKVSKKSE
jgi:hypothetical protein